MRSKKITPEVEYFTVHEVAAKLRISLWSLRQLIWRGQLPARLFGSRLRVAREDLQKFQADSVWSPRLALERGTARPRAGRPHKRTGAKRDSAAIA